MKQLLQELKNNPSVQSILKKESLLGNLSLTEESLLLAAAYVQGNQSFMIVKNNLYSAQRLYERLQCLLDEQVLLFSVEDSFRVEAIAASPEIKASQIEVMNALLTQQKSIFITHTGAIMRFLPTPRIFKSRTLHLEVDQEIGFDDLKNTLFSAGYTHVDRVDQPLCYASRGGIIDVYSINHEHPIRIEFFDNIIESIRYFDISTQRTIEIIKQADIIPATDLLFDDEQIAAIVEKANIDLNRHERLLQGTLKEDLRHHVDQDLDDICNHVKETHLYKYYAYLDDASTILDYVNKPMVFLSSEEEIYDNEKRIMEETISYIQELYEEGLSLPIYSLFADLSRNLPRFKPICFHLFVDYKQSVQSEILIQTQTNLLFEKNMEEVCHEASHKRVVLLVNKKEKETIITYLKDHHTVFKVIDEHDEITKGIQLLEHPFPEGFVCIKENISTFTGKELFQEAPKISRYSNKFKEAEVLHDYMELEPGDYVVHNLHGIGKYLGIVTKTMDNIKKDFLNIAYKGDDILLVPLDQFRLVRKFVSKEGASPKLNKLGSGDWEKTKSRISEKIAELAERLIKLYSIREEKIGFAYSKDSPLQKQFENDFEYELTKDQYQAVEEIKSDMESKQPMDRLLCGDVGFGKTEVAIRAAFKAVLDNKQVAFLCPTTILSLQHYKTFRKRFRNYPVEIEMINRFVSVKEQKQIIERLKKGQIDILIGTHRLLSKDIIFQDLGFLVIDEEQRFGVEHKEKIKELKNSVDVLSLSATPIPRTLQMSLIGIRSLSQLDTPPLNRMPVQTYVIEKNFQVTIEIMQRELARHGQVFYLYNNVKEIYNLTNKFKKALPDVNIGVAHGQMHRDDIEDVMLKFTANEYQILVCTTIIETGIDIPNANTIIIDQADRFGLSQLYQIKGRVGRSDRLAYAYLMYDPQKQLSEIAMKRLTSIKEFTQLGSGYKIAMRDLTIRGAGDMLGPQQAGFIDTVGIDMYIEMLNAAIMEKKGVKIEKAPEMIQSNAKVNAYIPNNFTSQDYEKLTLYQRIDEIHTKKELLNMMEEIRDNYGKLPKSVQMLFEKKRLDILINEKHVESFKESVKQIEINFTAEWSNHIDGVKLFEMMTTVSRNIMIRYVNKQIIMKLPKVKDWLFIVIEVLEKTEQMKQRTND